MKKPLPTPLTGNQIRQTFIDYFTELNHTFVPSASLVPAGDQTLLFTNAGMVQFKDVFLGIDKRPYTRATNSQKCMRVAGKHNDLEDVGRDDTHHTFFEMLGNWSFGDYYKKEAIAWAWHLLTEAWGLPKDRLYATCFEDEKGEIPRDDEAAEHWRRQPGFDPAHVLFFGRKDNFWEMADTGPCGPCSEVHLDRGEEYCNLSDAPGHVCRVNGDCTRFLELWNLVFIQYNRTDSSTIVPLPATHVDTGMGFERIVSVLQGVTSNYRTDLLWPLIETTQQLTGHTDAERESQFTPYRVIADHARAAAFLIADGITPGNTGRNYVCRMIVRRAARFGSQIGLNEPFLAQIASRVIENYGDFYPELLRNRAAILDSLTREEQRFQRTVEGGLARLENLLDRLRASGEKTLPGAQAFDLYATYGLPLEITRDILREHNLDVDEPGFHLAMDEHRLASGGGEAMGELGGEEVDIYAPLLSDLRTRRLLGRDGVRHDPYGALETPGELLALLVDGQPVASAPAGEKVEVILSETCFYVEAGGQVSDTGVITSLTRGERENWEIEILDVRRPVGGIIVHVGQVKHGEPHVGDRALARVDAQRRDDIVRNHTATHLLHAELRAVLGEHARQAGSLVAPDRLRFDFTHPEAVTSEQLARIEAGVNRRILENHRLNIVFKPLQQAVAEGATALFGEKYGEIVRNITIGDAEPFSNELCGGTHLNETAGVGAFLITSEGSVASGVRRIEAVTGRGAYELIQRRLRAVKETAALLTCAADEIPQKTRSLLEELSTAHKQIAALRGELAQAELRRQLTSVTEVASVPVLISIFPDADAETLRRMTDIFRQEYPSGVAVVASAVNERPVVVVSISNDLVSRGLHAGELAKFVAAPLGGSGGGRPNLAQAGGKDASKLEEALGGVKAWLEEKLKDCNYSA